VDETPRRAQFLARERREGGDGEQIEDGAADDGTDPEFELAVDDRTDDDGTYLGKTRADADDVDGDW